jgi:hypothetical protein
MNAIRNSLFLGVIHRIAQGSPLLLGRGGIALRERTDLSRTPRECPDESTALTRVIVRSGRAEPSCRVWAAPTVSMQTCSVDFANRFQPAYCRPLNLQVRPRSLGAKYWSQAISLPSGGRS